MPGEFDDDDGSDFMSDISSVVSKSATERNPIESSLLDDSDEDLSSKTSLKSNEPDKTDPTEKMLELIETPEEKAERKKLTVKKPEQQVQEPQQQPQQTQQKNENKTPYLDRFLKQDAKGNLILADGTIVATSGTVRSYYEGLKKEGRFHREAADKLALSNAELARNMQELNELYKAEKANNGYDKIVKDTGMLRSEVDEGIRLMKMYKQDPVNAIKSLLTQARISGIDLSSIGVTGGIDPTTLAQAIARARDFAEPAQEVDPDEKLRQEITQEVDSFFERHADAIQHIDVLAAAKQKYPDASLDQLWYQYKIWMRKQLEVQSEAEFNTPQQKQQVAKPQEIKPVLKPQPQRDYGAMSIDDIAASLKRDLTNG